MATIPVNLEDLKASVIHELNEHSRRPIELLTSLAREYPDSSIKEAVLRLLQEGRIEFTSDRLLRASHRDI